MFKIIFLFVVLTSGDMLSYGGNTPTYDSFDKCQKKVEELRSKNLSDIMLKNNDGVFMKAICVPVFGQRS